MNYQTTYTHLKHLRMSEYLLLSPTKTQVLVIFKKNTTTYPFKDPVLLSIHHTSFHDTQQTRWEDLGFAPVELPPEPQPDAQQRATKLRRCQVAVNFWRIWGRLKEGVGWLVCWYRFFVVCCIFLLFFWVGGWGVGGGGW